MNCIRCNAPLPADARFCGNCGAPFTINVPTNDDSAHPVLSQANLPVSADNDPTFSTMSVEVPESAQVEQTEQTQQAWITVQHAPQQKWVLPGPQTLQALQPSQFQAQAPTSAQQPYYQPGVPAAAGTLQSTGLAGREPRAFAPPLPGRRRRGRRLRITLIMLLILIAVLAGAWTFALRPYLHSLAQDQLDSALSSAVNQIDLSQLPQVPAGVPLPPLPLIVTEDQINNFYFPLIHVPSSPVQNMHIQITANEMQLDFTVYGFAGNITGTPTLINGNLVVTNVSVGGIAGLVMSSDEMTTLLNKHLADVQARLGRPINEVLLMDHELDIILG